MSRAVSDVPFAIGTDGHIYINLAHWGPARPRELLDRALGNRGELLVAVRASPSEARKMRERLRDGAAETVSLAIVSRQHKQRRRAGKGGRNSANR
jgi:hypothetical protein